MNDYKKYVLITPAKNEAKFLQRLIDCVLKQTIMPIKWLIIDDNSNDKTAEIAIRASNSFKEIQVVLLKDNAKRSFGSKAIAFRKGYETLKGMSFNYIGNLDADVTISPYYYERIIYQMNKNRRLGVASGVLYDKTKIGYKRTISNLNHAVGAVQFWRRECYEEVGGYMPTTLGGVDSLAERKARMKGWETKSFEDLPVLHHKQVDSASGKNSLRIAYRSGLTDYYIGTHPFFAVLKAVRRWRERPLFIYTAIRLIAYLKLLNGNNKRDASDELVTFLYREEMNEVFNWLRNFGIDRIKIFGERK